MSGGEGGGLGMYIDRLHLVVSIVFCCLKIKISLLQP